MGKIAITLIAAFLHEMEQMLTESQAFAIRNISPMERLSLAMEELPRILANYGNLIRGLFQVWSEGTGEMKQQIEAAWERLNRHDHALITKTIKRQTRPSQSGCINFSF